MRHSLNTKAPGAGEPQFGQQRGLMPSNSRFEAIVSETAIEFNGGKSTNKSEVPHNGASYPCQTAQKDGTSANCLPHLDLDAENTRSARINEPQKPSTLNTSMRRHHIQSTRERSRNLAWLVARGSWRVAQQ